MENIEKIDDDLTLFQKTIVFIIISGLIWFIITLVINYEMEKIKKKERIYKKEKISTGIYKLDSLCSLKLPNNIENRALKVEYLNRIFKQNIK